MEEKKQEAKNRILKYLKEGCSKKDSSVLAGISEASFYRWVEEDEGFKSHVEASTLEYKHTLIKNLIESAVKDGRLALEILKRKYPSEWGENVGLIRGHDDYEKERKDVVGILEKIYSDASDRNREIQ